MIKDESLKMMASQMFGMTEEDMQKVTPELEEELLNAMARIGNFRLVAEVVSSKYCFAGLQPGQKYVVENGAQLNREQSDAPICLGAVRELIEKAHIMMDRVYHGGDVTAHVAGYRCTDPGLDLGGLGCVEFKVTIEEK
jgi:uncharacterized repeat protein (TIGR04076 family)